MNRQTSYHQRGASLAGNILLLAAFGYGIYLGIQYVPFYLESKSIDSILQSIEAQHQSQRFEAAQQVDQAVRKNLNMNQMDDMMTHVRIRENPSGISIEINYDRELDLLFDRKTLSFSKTTDLD